MSTFGRPNAFGSATGTTGFGSINQQPQNSLFGNSTAGFGSTNTTNNLFGQQQTTTPSLFGNAVTTQPQSSVFGNSTANTGFATSNTLFSGTGTMSNSQNLFGGSKFGTSSSNLFGNNTSTSLTAFSSIPSVVGTTIKFNPFLSSDTMVKNGNNQNINTRHQCITCMKEYESKSLEELRYEDYQAGRKGTAASPMFGSSNTQTGGLFTSNPSTSVVPFNSSNTSSSIFNSNKPAFGATTTTATTSIFNTTFNKSFGTTGNSFGTTQSQPIQPTQTSIFGTSNAAATTGFNQNNLFNISSQNNSTSTTVKPFFTATTAPTNSMFQSTSTTNNALSTAKPFFGTSTSTFGAPTSSSSFTFNPTTQAASTTTNSLFSANQGSSLFNMNPATNTQTKSMFNFPSQTTTLNSQSTLNTTNPTGSSLFNTSGLGTTTLGTTSNLFGTMNNNSNSLFGTSNNTTSALGMNQNTNQSGMLSLQQISSPTNQNNNNLLMNRLQSLPYGSSSLFQNKVGTPNSSLKFTTDPKILNQYKVSFTSSSNNQIQKTPTNTLKNTSLLFDGLDDENPDDKKTAFNIFVPRKNIKKLTIKPKDSSTLSTLTEDTINVQTKNSTQSDFTLKLPLNSKKICDSTVNADNTVLEYFRQPPKAYSSTPAANTSVSLPVQSPAQSVILDKSQANRNNQLILNSPETSVNVSLNDSQNYSILGHNSGDCASPVVNTTFSIPKCKVILNRTEYFTIPPLDQLEVDDNTCIVESFTVGRHGYGSIFWEGPLDIYGINLDECVHIRRKEVFVYPDDENKPEEGSGLNRPAQITLHKVWPIDKTTHEVIKDPQRLLRMNYSEKIENATIKFGGFFKEYRPDSGTWVFKVKHFSKYGLIDEDEEDEPMPMQITESSKKENEFEHRQNLNYYPYKEEFENMNSLSKHEIPPFNKNTEYNEFLNLGNSSKQFIEDNFDQQNISQKFYSNDRHFLNFEEDEENEEFENEGMDNLDYPEEIPVANTYNYLLRNILFENEEKNLVEQNYEQTSKKKKTLIKSDFLIDRDEYFNQGNSFSLIQPKITHKLDIVLKPDSYPAKNKIYYDISSLKCSGSPKVRFMHGFNNLIMADGRNVNIYDLKLINETVNLSDRFNLQMNRNSELFLSSEKAPFIQVKPTIENKHNPDKLEKLIKALFGHLNIENEHEYTQARTNRIIDWLTEQNKKLIKPTNLLERIIYYLSTNEIKSAVDDLILANHPKLALLICSGNNFAFKNNICQQLLEWKTLQGDLFISKDLLKIYVLLSGETKYRLSNNFLIDVLDNLTWTQQLSLLLLYSVDNNLEDCINNMTCETNDVEYHLIANHNPLVAMSSAENDLEAWFLHQSLKSYGIIDSDTNSDVIHGLLSSQLMAKNIKWACYVACHITHDLLREYTLTELLFNYVGKLTTEDEDWLKINLRLHNKYIASIKAQFAKSNFDVVTHGEELLECEKWIEAHDVLVESIFPELVINEEYEKLKNLIDKLKPYKEIIPNWYTSGAHLFEVYIQCVYSETLDNDLMNEPFNFSLMKCKNHRQRLCQSEMARKINLIYHEFNKERFLLKTPVPSDYALKELRFNSRSILKELCS